MSHSHISISLQVAVLRERAGAAIREAAASIGQSPDSAINIFSHLFSAITQAPIVQTPEPELTPEVQQAATELSPEQGAAAMEVGAGVVGQQPIPQEPMAAPAAEEVPPTEQYVKVAASGEDQSEHTEEESFPFENELIDILEMGFDDLEV